MHTFLFWWFDCWGVFASVCLYLDCASHFYAFINFQIQFTERLSHLCFRSVHFSVGFYIYRFKYALNNLFISRKNIYCTLFIFFNWCPKFDILFTAVTKNINDIKMFKYFNVFYSKLIIPLRRLCLKAFM